MAIIPADEKVFMVDKRTNTTYGGSKALQDMQQWYTMQDVSDSIQPYKVYTALLTQTGTDAPVATILQNTLGGTPVWSRSGVGTYAITLAGAFPINKTVCFLTIENNDSDGRILGSINYSGAPNANVRGFVIQNATTNSNTDELAALSCIEIRVYN
jgi:hypothetical protein